MKTHILALMAIMALTLYESQMAVAQWGPSNGRLTQGIFGPRVIGGPIAGTPAIGTFGYRAVGAPLVQGPGNFTSSVIQASPYGGYVLNNPSYGYQVVTPTSTSGQWYGNNMMNYPVAQEPAYGSTPETNMGQDIGPTMQGNPTNFGAAQQNTNLSAAPAGGTPGAMQPGVNPSNTQPGASTGATQPGANLGTAVAPTVNVTPQRAKFYTASVLSTQRQPFYRSPELSDRLTNIARSRGMLVGKGINVYMSNDIARVQGTVHTPADSAALASVLGLEPDVQHIDNRLSVGSSGN